MGSLSYERDIILETHNEDGLSILARGLGVERILLNFIKVYCDPGNLVLVLNTNNQEESYTIEQLLKEEIAPLPKVVTSDCSIKARKDLYLQGGVLFITSRILAVDMLTDRLPIELVTGILVYKAHRIIESCQEAFILRLYRQKNKTGFIKAFSDSPGSFTSGFSHVERVMKNLYVKKLFLWPRFQLSVVQCLEANKPEVVEIHVHMTPAMQSCQMSILELIDACVKELIKGNVSLDTDIVSVENVITKDFEKSIRILLDPIWHQLSSKTRSLVADLKTLRLLLQHLTQYDCVTFFCLYQSLRASERKFSVNSGWMFLDAAETLYINAKKRVYCQTQTSKKEKQTEIDTNVPPEDMEECSKWEAVSEILKEIEEENKNADPELGPGRVLIAAEDDRTCNQIREYLRDGGQAILQRLYEKHIMKKDGREELDKKKRKRPKGVSKLEYEAKKANEAEGAQTLTQMQRNTSKSGSDESESEESDHDILVNLLLICCPPDWNSAMFSDRSIADTFDIPDEAYKFENSSTVTIIHPLHGCTDPYSLTRTMLEIKPRYVILYDADMMFVRQLEVYKASNPGVPLRVYFIMYTGSTEEQRYLTSLRKEKEAFEHLIREKANMVVPEERSGLNDDDPTIARGSKRANETVNSRRGGGGDEEEGPRKIIVDMREFRSELPSLIHRRGIDIEPVTVEVGDYILSPEMCVERKSLSDLIGSLNSGRLYNQCVAMTRFYKKPILLIEFDPNKPFALQQGKHALSTEFSSHDVMSKLALLTLHFPNLRILWCPSPYATAELFEELKCGKEEPDVNKALAITEEMGGNETDELDESKYNHGPHDTLMKMPGINTKNIKYILNKVDNLYHLTKLSEAELATILDNKMNAKKLWTFLHSQQETPDQSAAVKPKKSKRR